MIQQATLSTTAGQDRVAKAAAIPKLKREESAVLARTELTRFLHLIENLSPADWSLPTACTLWTVKDIVAHQAAHVLAATRFTEFLSQFDARKFRDYTAKGMNSLDAANQRQVDLRATRTPAELITEMKTRSEASLAGRQRFPWLVRKIRTAVPGYHKPISLGELIDVIFTRDMWMHRLDVCRATGHTMVLTPEHDGRINALTMRDLAQNLSDKLNGQTVMYRLTGAAGGEWLLGTAASVSAVVTMDALDFNWLASKHINGQDALAQNIVKVEGDQVLAELVIHNTTVLY